MMFTHNKGTLYNYTCSSGLLLPMINEFTWPIEVRAVLYFCGLLYCFLGVAIIADVFMSAIEKITSKTRTLVIANPKKDEPDVIEVRVWNDTVANLTLMALGSSAPEILLSVIEIAGKNFNAGDLGPGTIVGSAAFNLFFITAICVVSIPKGETRPIKEFKVFCITGLFSILAYLWLLVILKATSPGFVDTWEAAITLILFPLLVVLAYLAEKNFCAHDVKDSGQKQIELGRFQQAGIPSGYKLVAGDIKTDGTLDADKLAEFVKQAKKFPGISDEDAALLAASRLVDDQSHSRMWYRVGAVRQMSGSRRITPKLNSKLKEVYEALNEHPDAPDIGSVKEVDTVHKAVVEFHAPVCAFMENCGTCEIMILRHGRTDNRVTVKVETIDGSAQGGMDYVPISKTITFEPGEGKKYLSVDIIDDNQWEPDEEFFIKLSLLDSEDVELGNISIMEITILDNDEPGVVSFARRGILVQESIGTAVITVVRRGGTDGIVSVKWKTVEKTAIDGKDYIGGTGELTFQHGEKELNIEIPIINDMNAEKDEHFQVELFDAEGGLKIGNVSRTFVTITNDDDYQTVMNRMMLLTSTNLDAMRVYRETWKSQIRDAMNVNGGDVENATGQDYVLHFMTFGWKIMFALVPPPSVLGGWLCFFVSLGVIGLITAIVGDLASIFGCLVGLKDSITAITFVALGTSLPDLFASRTAARQEKYADNSIGNVTGSNSVNVFFGLGLPWMMASIYHEVNNGRFAVDPGTLGFSVSIYSIFAFVCLGLLIARRYIPYFGKAELGGPTIPKYLTGLVMVILWFLYVLIISLQAYDHISGF